LLVILVILKICEDWSFTDTVNVSCEFNICGMSHVWKWGTPLKGHHPDDQLVVFPGFSDKPTSQKWRKKPSTMMFNHQFYVIRDWRLG
jgi:hypothetical protein